MDMFRLVLRPKQTANGKSQERLYYYYSATTTTIANTPLFTLSPLGPASRL